MDTRKIVGLATAAMVSIALVLWAVGSSDPNETIEAISIALAVLAGAALIAALVVDARHFVGPARSNWDFALVALSLLLALRLASDGMPFLALAVVLGAALLGVMRVRVRQGSRLTR